MDNSDNENKNKLRPPTNANTSNYRNENRRPQGSGQHRPNNRPNPNYSNNSNNNNNQNRGNRRFDDYNNRDRSNDRNQDRNPNQRYVKKDGDRSSHNNNRRNNRDYGRNRPNRYYQKNRPSPISAGEALLKKFNFLLDQHNMARKKYYEMYYRAELPFLRKLERQFYLSLEDLRRFEKSLNPDQRKELSKLSFEYCPELTYETNHLEEIKNETKVEVKIEDPHLLPTQMQRQKYNEDREESSGSLDDYKRYKDQ